MSQKILILVAILGLTAFLGGFLLGTDPSGLRKTKAHRSLASGKFTFVNKSNYDNYLKAINVGMLKRNVLSSEKPDITAYNEGNQYSFDFITTLKTIKIRFVIDQVFQADFGYDQLITYLPSLTNENSILLQNIDNPNDRISFAFTTDGLVISYFSNDVSASRTFKRA